VKDGHLFLNPNTKAVYQNSVLFSEADLTSLHRKLGHPSAESVHRFLTLSKPGSIQESDRDLLTEIQKECIDCERFGPRPRRLRAVIPATVVFNHEVSIDVYYIHGYPALSVVCTATSFVASSFLESRHSAVIWDTFQRIWCCSYAGVPSIVRLDSAGEHT
jgi:hypothetical protein